MQTKLTLRLDDRLIRRAKAYARESGKSLSEVVADLFARLHAPASEEGEPQSPAVRSLAGALRGKAADRESYRAHLGQKYKQAIVRVLFDTNVVLDVLLARAPHAAPATMLFDYVARKELDGWLGATSITTIFYLAAKASSVAKASRHVHTLLSLFDVAPVTRSVLDAALHAGFKDYEDAVLHEAAREIGASAIVTRDASGFAASKLRVYGPAELLQLVRAAE